VLGNLSIQPVARSTHYMKTHVNRSSDTKIAPKLPDRKMTEQLIRERAAPTPAKPANGEGVAECLPGECIPPA
jgi:hypothetical protein